MGTTMPANEMDGTSPLGSDRAVHFTIEFERETDGRWIAEVIELPGVMVYGETQERAMASVEALALRVMADRLDRGECLSSPSILFDIPAA
jgi:predicted RNase H-like HicB family nuclease